MNKRLLFQSVLVMLFSFAWAQGPNDSGTYYQNADGKTGAELKTALCEIINPHIQRSYGDLWEDFKKTDKKDNGKVWDMYSNMREFTFDTDKAGNYSGEGDVYNREHSFPKSWFNDDYPPYTDLNHLYPTDGWVNGQRGNLPFGEVGPDYTSSNDDFSKWGSARSGLGYSGKVFEPNDEYKGDFARTYFYMVTCYESYTNSKGQAKQITSWNCPMLDGKLYPGFSDWALTMLMRWAKNDPVSEKELNRNKAVYDIQHNRNPFIDYPGLEDYIWGDKVDVPFSYDGSGGGAVTVAKPLFSMAEGTYFESITVSMTCSTPGASIYYTVNGGDASEQSTLYTAPVTFSEVGTYQVKAVAILDGERSAQNTVTYVITEQGGSGGETPADCEIALGNAFFGTSFSGEVKNYDDDLVGTENGVTVVYSKGSGSNRYCNDTQIRLYAGNTLTVSVAQGSLTGVEFVTASGGSSSKTLSANSGSVDGMKWTGDASSVQFEVSSGSGHIRVASLKINVNVPGDPSGIDFVQTNTLAGQRVIYDLSGRRVTNPTKGIYIVDGRKVVVR